MTTPVARREYECTLPIGFTDDEGNLHRVAVLRKMTGREESILADRRNQRNGGKLVTELLHNCLVRLGDREKNGEATRKAVAALYSADRNYLLLKLRTITFGAELEASYGCPSCGEATTVLEDLEGLPVRRLSEGESPEDVVVQLEDGYVDKDGTVHTAMTLRLPTGVDEEAVAPDLRRNPSLGKNALLARCMKTLGDLPRHRIEAIGPRILADLTLGDRRLIDRALNQAAPGADLLREIECSHCGTTFKTSLDMTHFFALE